METILLQGLFIFFTSMVPFLEVFITVPVGIIVFNFPLFAVLLLAIAGNAISVLLFVFFGVQINKFFTKVINKFRKHDKEYKPVNPRVKHMFNRLGPTAVCFASSLLFSSQIGASAISTLGAPRKKVFIWTTLGVSTLAVVMATLSITAEGFVTTFVNIS